MRLVLTALGATVAVTVEMLEALAIVLAVGVSRHWRDAVLGGVAALVACFALAAVLGPVLAGLPLDTLRVVIGTLLLLYGLEWLRKGTLRLAGRRARSSSVAEFLEAQAELETVPPPAAGRPDWAARAIAFKGVFIEGVEVVVIVGALAARPGGVAPALIGALVALVLVVALGARLREPLSRVPETELKYGVGLVLSSLGLFFAGEGLGIDWPAGDAALAYLAALLALVTQLQSHALARRPREPAT